MSRLFRAAGLALVAGVITTSMALAQSQSAPSQPVPSPLCIYNSANYSDGAYICAQKSMMLTCQVDGAKATWKMVTDKEINDRCIAPLAQRSPVKRVRHRFRGSQVYPATDSSARCFNFNGKRYCE